MYLNNVGDSDMPNPLVAPRVSTAEQAQAICERIWTDDQPGSINRGLQRGLVDGAPPYDRGEVARNGQLMRCNINWLTARAALNNARALYVDLVNSVPNFISVEFGGEIDPADASEYSMVIAEEFSRTLRNWGQFQFQLDQLIDQFVGYGVGFGYHDSMRDWRWIGAGLGDVLFPRSTNIDEESVEIVMMRRPYFPFELMDQIRDKQSATDRGWNVPEVINAVMTKAQGNDPRLGNDYEQLEKEMFESTFYYSYASKTEMIWTDHLYVREIDGGYSHMITLTEKGGDFLFFKEKQYEKAEDFFTIFPNGGGNGDIHGQRGLLFDIFSQTQAINQIQCEFIDNMRLSMSMMLQVNSEEALLDLGMVDLGPFKILPPGVQVVPANLNPPNGDALNALNYLSQQQAANTGQYSPLASTGAIQNSPTAYQARAATANDNTLSQSQTNTFYAKWTHLLRRMYRRLSMDDWHASEPGGKEALEFQKRCYAKGIPMPTEEQNILASPIDIQAVRAVGYGSPANRMSVQGQLMQLAGQMSPEAQNELMRNTVASITSAQEANLYFPRMATAPSQVEDQKIAQMENSFLMMGQQQSVFGNNLIHATAHTAAIVQMMQSVLQPQPGNQVSPQAIVTFLQSAIQHTQEHLQLLAKDNVNQGKVEQFTPILVQANALMQKAMTIQQKNAAQAAQLAGQNAQAQADANPPPDPLEQGKTQAQIADIQSKIQERQFKMQVTAAEAKSKIETQQASVAHKDASLAHKITVDSQKAS